jgi:hypothetical protein
MATIRKELIINAPPADAWDAIRDYGAVHERVARGFVLDTVLDGDARIVTFANGLSAREVLVTLDDEARRLAYSAVGGRLTHHNASLRGQRALLHHAVDHRREFVRQDVRDPNEARGADLRARRHSLKHDRKFRVDSCPGARFQAEPTRQRITQEEEVSNPDMDVFVEQYKQAWRSRAPGVMATMWHRGGRLRHPALDREIDGTLVPRNNDRTKQLPEFEWTLGRWASSGENVFLEWTAKAKIAGELRTWSGVDCMVVRDGRIVEEVVYFDTYFLRRLVRPDLPEFSLAIADEL